ncbi:hypothetical protein [Flavobacterium soli]|uniref:hypothetical protein n=1 Tax=Flavobacterium soli TaxID=344881 RepID=UPI0004047A66|nr:hypothetical protein [Flavobacterium soli]
MLFIKSDNDRIGDNHNRQTASLALIEVEILAFENVFFPDRKERLVEAPFVSWKKTFSRARL